MRRLFQKYAHWLHLQFPAGGVEKLPRVDAEFRTNVPGVYVVGDLAGVPLLKYSLDSGTRAVRTIAQERVGSGDGHRQPPVQAELDGHLQHEVVAVDHVQQRRVSRFVGERRICHGGRHRARNHPHRPRIRDPRADMPGLDLSAHRRCARDQRQNR